MSPSLELADAILLVVMISRGFALSTALVLRLGLFGEIWPHNGFYLRLLKILYVSFLEQLDIARRIFCRVFGPFRCLILIVSLSVLTLGFR